MAATRVTLPVATQSKDSSWSWDSISRRYVMVDGRLGAYNASNALTPESRARYSRYIVAEALQRSGALTALVGTNFPPGQLGK